MASSTAYTKEVLRDDSLEICTSFPWYLEGDSWNHESRPRVVRAHSFASTATWAFWQCRGNESEER